MTAVDPASLLSHFREIDRLLKKGDLAGLFEYGRSLRQAGQVKGVALARLLYEMYQAWDTLRAKNGVERDDFIDLVRAEVGVAQETAIKYIRMYGQLMTLPDDVRLSLLENKPVEHLLLVSPLTENRLTRRQWADIVATPNKATLRDEVRKIRGQKTSSKAALVISLDRQGRLLARRGSKLRTIGLLKIDDESMQDEVHSAAVNRLITAAGIIER